MLKSSPTLNNQKKKKKRKAKTNEKKKKKKERKKEGSLVDQLPWSHCFTNTKLLKLSFTNAPYNPILRPKHHF